MERSPVGAEAKAEFKELQERDPSIPLFLQPDWMETLHEKDNEWGVVLSGRKGDIKGFLPFSIRYRAGLRLIGMPYLTPYMGPWLYFPEKGGRDYEMRTMRELIEGLPSFHEFDQKFHPAVKNWFPFYTQAFRQSTLYTNILPVPSQKDIRSVYTPEFRNHLKKLEESTRIVQEEDIHPLLQLHEKEQQKRRIPELVDQETLAGIDELLASRKDRRILYAYDDQGDLLGGVYLARDEHSVYYLMGSSDPERRALNPIGRLLHEGYEWASGRGLPFDLAGSMIPSIERAYRRMGSEPLPHHRVWQRKGMIIKSLRFLQGKKR
ncbi:MAG: GNAT family N-acetyltransferase [Flavobacteriales bacterium]